MEVAPPMLAFGFVDYMPGLMRACDLVVTKAGPGAIAEALAAGLPLVITGFLPGQETSNVDFVVESRIGAFAPKKEDLLDEVRVMAEGGPTWREMSRKAEEMAHPYASSDIARECLLLAARYRASAQASRSGQSRHFRRSGFDGKRPALTPAANSVPSSSASRTR